MMRESDRLLEFRYIYLERPNAHIYKFMLPAGVFFRLTTTLLIVAPSKLARRDAPFQSNLVSAVTILQLHFNFLR